MPNDITQSSLQLDYSRFVVDKSAHVSRISYKFQIEHVAAPKQSVPNNKSLSNKS